MGKRNCRQLWQTFWRIWTIDRPAALGDWLWLVLVVELAALLDRLTLRKLIALIPVVTVIGAYLHRIPLPPELMLVGHMLAYIDICSMVFLLGHYQRPPSGRPAASCAPAGTAHTPVRGLSPAETVPVPATCVHAGNAQGCATADYPADLSSAPVHDGTVAGLGTALYGASKFFAGGGLADLAVEHLSKG